MTEQKDKKNSKKDETSMTEPTRDAAVNDKKAEKGKRRLEIQEKFSLPTLSFYDGTSDMSDMEIFLIREETGSQGIIEREEKVFDFDKLEELKEKNAADLLLNEGKRQVIEIFHCTEWLDTHNNTYIVYFFVDAGRILNFVEESFGEDKTDYYKWINDSGMKKYQRKINQAKDLAKIEDFAIANATLGKNRLLELNRALKVSEFDDFEKLFAKYPFQELTEEDEKHEKFKLHVDKIITYYRFYKNKNKDGKFVTFDQAENIARDLKKSLKVSDVEDVLERIYLQPEANTYPKKRKALDEMINNDEFKGSYKASKILGKRAEEKSLEKIIALLGDYIEKNKEKFGGMSFVEALNGMDSSVRKSITSVASFVNALNETNAQLEKPVANFIGAINGTSSQIPQVH